MFREFEPTRRPATGRVLLALLCLAFAVLPGVLGVALLTSSHRVEYRIDGERLFVATGGFLDRDLSVALGDIASVREVRLSRGRRQAGTALPGYCVGRFQYAELGSVWQATDCGLRGLLLTVRDEDRPVLLSPPDVPRFERALKERTFADVRLPPARRGVLALPVALSFLGVAALLPVALVLLLGPRRLRYRVGDGVVEVSTFFSRRRWPARELRARRHSPRVSFRTFGTAAPGYYTGRFRADGASTRIYATHLEDGVLLEGPERVYLSPADTQAFLEELRAAGAHIAEEPTREEPRS